MTKPGPKYAISYHHFVVSQDIPTLDGGAKRRIKKAIEVKLTTSPEIFGLPLRGTLGGYWKLRVGDWRVVYTIKSRQVKVIIISHRSKVYNLIKAR